MPVHAEGDEIRDIERFYAFASLRPSPLFGGPNPVSTPQTYGRSRLQDMLDDFKLYALHAPVEPVAQNTPQSYVTKQDVYLRNAWAFEPMDWEHSFYEACFKYPFLMSVIEGVPPKVFFGIRKHAPFVAEVMREVAGIHVLVLVSDNETWRRISALQAHQNLIEITQGGVVLGACSGADTQWKTYWNFDMVLVEDPYEGDRF